MLFDEHPSETYTLKETFRSTNMTTHPMKMLCRTVLQEFVLDGYLKEVANNTFKRHMQDREIIGIFNRKRNGKNFVIPEELTEEEALKHNILHTDEEPEESEHIFIAERNAARAMNGDRVRVALFAKRQLSRDRR